MSSLCILTWGVRLTTRAGLHSATNVFWNMWKRGKVEEEQGGGGGALQALIIRDKGKMNFQHPLAPANRLSDTTYRKIQIFCFHRPEQACPIRESQEVPHCISIGLAGNTTICSRADRLNNVSIHWPSLRNKAEPFKGHGENRQAE